MKINIKLLESNSVITKNILQEISKYIDVAISKSLTGIKEDIEKIVLDSVKNEPEYLSLKNGQLKYEFGIPNTSVVDSILEKIINTINIHKKNTTFNQSGVVGGFVLTALDENDIISFTSLPEAMVIDTKNGYSLPWLQWLLLEGAKPIVKNYDVKVGPNRASRTGMAIMVKDSGSWSVPNSFIGTRNSNWFTRAIDNINDNTIENSIIHNLEKYL